MLSALILASLDLVGLTLAMYGALVARQAYLGHILLGLPWNPIEVWLKFVGLVLVLVFAMNGLYRTRESRTGSAAILKSLVVVLIVTTGYARLVVGKPFSTFYAFPIGIFLLSCVLIVLLRASYDSVTHELMRVFGITRRTVIAGPSAAITTLDSTLRRSRRGPDVEVIGAVTVHGYEKILATAPTLGGLSDLSDIIVEYQPDDLVLTGVELDRDMLLELLETCREQGTRLRVVPQTTELLLERAVLVPGQAVPLFEVRPPVLAGIDWLVKRTFDIVVSALALVVLALPGLIVAAIIRLTSGGSAIYRDRRIGVGEQEFDLYKFRSMYTGSAAKQAELEQQNEADGAIFKMRLDPRVTPFGRLLRRFSIDELPQLVNVMRGEMSLVGPRPLPLRDFAKLEPWHRGRNRVLPGITGLWQVSGRSELSFDDLVRLDFYYVENWSIWIDITILLRTPFAVARGRGAY